MLLSQIRQLISFKYNGVYEIGELCATRPFYTPSKQFAYCDMKSDGGGWIVIQKRVPRGKENFTRNWTDYENGFGDLSGEFWVGLRNINCLTTREAHELRIDMKLENGTSKTWTYQTFAVAGPGDKYRLTIGGGVGDGGDGMVHSNGIQFSTFDSDNDQNRGSCVSSYQGGWWYKNCYRANLNGPHTIPLLSGVDRKWGRLIWIDNISADIYSYVPSVEMKIRPIKCKQCTS